MTRKSLAAVFALALAAGLVFGSCSKRTAAGPVDLSGLSLDQLIAEAKKEGHIESVGMPDDWADWGSSWKALSDKYGLTHFDTDMSSAEEIQIFKAEADSPTKDIGDVGHAYGKVAIDEDVVQGYKPSTWNTIPDWAKDPDARWILSYTGTMAWAINTNLTGGRIPRTWKELKEGNYKVSVGNVVGGASSQAMVIGAALAYGGGLDNVRPGIEFFKDLARAGRITGAYAGEALARGEIEISANYYDYSCLGWKESINARNTDVKIEVVIPQDGAITTGYCLIFNKTSPHPHATALAIEYLLSDEGQIDRARGFARPIRDVTLPSDVQARLLPSDQYRNAVAINDPDVLARACSEVGKLWEEEVIPLIR
ncbi:MAG: extracellular solute-binding protein [Spirochaetaceae bacterium]|jgi:putative spermidine/putrescine transport system substrate-binding protein|nr:extracellular solute-binding protein [Spirochaetaceae bacterium]